MKKDYTVQFVDDRSFDALPGENMGGKLGVAYPEIGKAYVRKTGSSMVDVFTAMHELEHLEGKDHDEVYDKEHKCYYKDFGKSMSGLGSIAGPLMMAIPGMQPLGIATMAGAGIGKAANARQDQKSAMGQQMSQQASPYGGMNQLAAPMPNVIYTQGGGGGQGGGDGGGSASGASPGRRPAHLAADQMGYYQNRNPFSQFGGF